MKYPGVNTFAITFYFILWVLPGMVYGQSDKVSPSGREGKPEADTGTSVHALFAGLGGGSNMIYLGSTISQGNPFYSAGITYGYRNRLFISGSASHLASISPFVAFNSLSGSYSRTFNSWFDISAVISGYHAPESLQQTVFNDFAFVNLTAGFDWKLVYTKLSIGDLISDENSLFLQIRNSRYFETPEFFNGKALITFDPNINILFGRLVKIVTTTGVTRYGNSPPFRHLKKEPGNIIKSYSYTFGLMDLEFSLPVSFSYNNLTIEIEPGYIMPLHSNSYYPSPQGFSFNVNSYIRIF